MVSVTQSHILLWQGKLESLNPGPGVQALDRRLYKVHQRVWLDKDGLAHPFPLNSGAPIASSKYLFSIQNANTERVGIIQFLFQSDPFVCFWSEISSSIQSSVSPGPRSRSSDSKIPSDKPPFTKQEDKHRQTGPAIHDLTRWLDGSYKSFFDNNCPFLRTWCNGRMTGVTKLLLRWFFKTDLIKKLAHWSCLCDVKSCHSEGLFITISLILLSRMIQMSWTASSKQHSKSWLGQENIWQTYTENCKQMFNIG